MPPTRIRSRPRECSVCILVYLPVQRLSMDGKRKVAGALRIGHPKLNFTLFFWNCFVALSFAPVGKFERWNGRRIRRRRCRMKSVCIHGMNVCYGMYVTQFMIMVYCLLSICTSFWNLHNLHKVCVEQTAWRVVYANRARRTSLAGNNVGGYALSSIATR